MSLENVGHFESYQKLARNQPSDNKKQIFLFKPVEQEGMKRQNWLRSCPNVIKVYMQYCRNGYKNTDHCGDGIVQKPLVKLEKKSTTAVPTYSCVNRVFGQ